MKNVDDRVVTVKCDFADRVCSLLKWVSVQLSDGYLEGRANFYGKFWNCLDFRKNNYDEFEIIIKSEPTYADYAEKTKMFLNASDEEVCDYIKAVIFHLTTGYTSVFESFSSRRVLNTLCECINDWKILSPPLPKMTHEELVKLVGHDFEYV